MNNRTIEKIANNLEINLRLFVFICFKSAVSRSQIYAILSNILSLNYLSLDKVAVDSAYYNPIGLLLPESTPPNVRNYVTRLIIYSVFKVRIALGIML
jgi:hypothetical protein